MPPQPLRPSTTASTTATNESGLNVIALISGGKDSLYSLLHCIRNGHRVVALANLHPDDGKGSNSSNERKGKNEHEDEDKHEIEDIDSFMYQTIGHNVIPLYKSALEIPLYRASIRGEAVDMGLVYGNDNTTSGSTSESGPKSTATSESGYECEAQDETESLIPLLTHIKKLHPTANAISAGAILSTYQRTRIESVAARMNLIPLSWLWMYPFLPLPVERKSLAAATDTSVDEAGLLDDMASVGCEARIIKVASGGLDGGFLWEDVSSSSSGVRRRLVKAMRRFVGYGDSSQNNPGGGVRGAVLGEGGEYETLALDGPGFLWKGRIEIPEGGREEGVGEGGVGYLRLKGARCVEKTPGEREDGKGPEMVRRPGLLDGWFEDVLGGVHVEDYRDISVSEPATERGATTSGSKIEPTQLHGAGIWTISNLTAPEAGPGTGEQMQAIMHKVKRILQEECPTGSRSTEDDIVFATLLLGSMTDFALVNSMYVSLFKKPNPPARVAVGCGSSLPHGVSVMISFVVDLGPRRLRDGLHVQSRSYWAPANIGPYSQAISMPFPRNSNTIRLVYIAGQIPLEPASMELITTESDQQSWFDGYSLRAVLALQHLWRVGTAMQVDWWAGAIAYLTGDENMDTKALVAWHVWEKMHRQEASDDNDEDDEDDDEPVLDAWDIKYGRRTEEAIPSTRSKRPSPPNFDLVRSSDGTSTETGTGTPPFLAVQVDQLPRASDVEWQGLGIRCSRVEIKTDSDNSHMMHVQVDEENQNGRAERMIFSGIEIDMKQAGPKFEDSLHKVLAECNKTAHAISHAVLYTTQTVSSETWPGPIIPCRRVWGPEGRKLAAGIFLQRTY